MAFRQTSNFMLLLSILIWYILKIDDVLITAFCNAHRFIREIICKGRMKSSAGRGTTLPQHLFLERDEIDPGIRNFIFLNRQSDRHSLST